MRRTSRSRAPRRRLRVIIVSFVTLAVAGAAAAIIISLQPAPPLVASTCTFGSGSAGGPYAVTPTQAQNAAIITAVGVQKGMPDHAATVALATSLQETQLQNLPYGDLDSVGLFQQRPSQGWGTTAQIMDPAYAAGAFFDHLAQVPGWESLPVTEAAQQVQHSATPDAYAQWALEAQALAIATTGEAAAGLACHLTSFGGAAPGRAALVAAATAELGPNPFGTPPTTQRGWQIAIWAVAHAFNYHLTSVSFGGQIWNSASGTWAAAPAVDHVVTSTQ
ncbi:MAG TPA: hypothetical protein VG412_10500 [Acidimicrobiales bacterium]|nr:hypothetical protein [Acidimicrobiales bacterium]